MRPRFALLAVLTAAGCVRGESRPRAAAVCAAPRVISDKELLRVHQRIVSCADRACVDALRADIEGVVVSFDDFAAAVEVLRAHGPGATAVEELRVITDHACGCNDVACAVAAKAELDGWAKKYEHVAGTSAHAEVSTELAKEMSACLMAVLSRTP